MEKINLKPIGSHKAEGYIFYLKRFDVWWDTLSHERRVLSLGRTVVFGGQYHFFFEGHSKCMMKMKCGDKTALVDIAVAICPGSNQISVAFGKKMHSYNTLFISSREQYNIQ
uniref:Bm503, isoform a n=1 Tax=Brugia malayi TaxID=6279 RepID=A0A1I9G305_BRUMA|nr:Bm503, isoform a [Brugia malayi]